MIRLAISVEGETEEDFVNLALVEHLRLRGVQATPISLDGGINISRLASEMAKLSWNFNAVTSLVDYYGFGGRGCGTVDELEERIDEEITLTHSRRIESSVFPYVQLHEFEGLLFSDISVLAYMNSVSEDTLNKLKYVRSQFETPEHINDGKDTAPSRRIKGMIPQYDKRVYGPLLAEEIGLETIRRECPRFNAWVTRMESLSNVQTAGQ